MRTVVFVELCYYVEKPLLNREDTIKDICPGVVTINLRPYELISHFSLRLKWSLFIFSRLSVFSYSRSICQGDQS